MIKHLILLILIIVSLSACMQKQVKPQTPEIKLNVPDIEQQRLETTEEDRTALSEAAKLVSQGQIDAAHQIYQLLYERKAENDDFVINLAMSHRRMGNLDDANKLLEALVTRQPGNVSALLELGTNVLEQGRVKLAQDYYTRALELESEDADLHYNLAILYELYLQSYSDAVKHYKRYLELSENDEDKTLIERRVQLLERSIR